MVAEAQLVPAPAVTVHFQLLGPVTATNAEGQPIRLGPTKQRGVLACLLLSANTVVSTGRLVSDVWGDDAPPTAIKMIHGSISRLRSALGPAAQLLLVTSGNGYQINVRPEALDVSRCRGLLAAGLEELTTDPHRPSAASTRRWIFSRGRRWVSLPTCRSPTWPSPTSRTCIFRWSRQR